MDPTTLKEVDYLNVYSFETKIKSINELEWIDGKFTVMCIKKRCHNKP
jgi:glutamine cyclotransferase